MKSFAGAFGIIFASLVLGAAAAQPTVLPSEESIRRLIDVGDWFEAAQLIDRLTDAHVATVSTLRPDPTLDRLIGEIGASSSPASAHLLLERAIADRSTRDLGRYTLLLAIADETLGDNAAAEAVYRRLLGDPALAASHDAAAVGLARLLLIDRPREAMATAVARLSQEPGGASRWEAALIAARAARILGLSADAERWLEEASRLAWIAPVNDAAIARVALDRGVVAGLSGNRAALAAMAALNRGGDPGEAARQFLSLLPECGLAGVRPDDLVVLELATRGHGRPRLGLIHASRPEIAGAFLAIAGRSPLVPPRGQAMSVLLRCGAAPRAGIARAWDNSILEWAASRGAYPTISFERGSREALRAELAARETQLGADSPFLIPLLAQILFHAEARSSFLSPGEAERSLASARRLDAMLAAQSAPADARMPVTLAIAVLNSFAVQQSQRAALRAVRTAVETTAANAALTIEALLLMVDFVPDETAIAPGLKIALYSQALERMSGGGGAGDPRRRGIAARLIRLQRDAGNESAAAALERDVGIARNLCVLAEAPPAYLSSDIRSEDYPLDAMWAEQDGLLAVDFTANRSGAPEDIRIVMAAPPFIFDGAMTARAPTIRYRPAESANAPRACRGQTQSISWRLPTDPD